MLKRTHVPQASHLRDRFFVSSNCPRWHVLQSPAHSTSRRQPERLHTTHRSFTTSVAHSEDGKETRRKAEGLQTAHIAQHTQKQPQVSDKQYASLTRFENSSLPIGHVTNWFDKALRVDEDDNFSDCQSVRLCGYLTAKRNGRGFDFLQLIDPTLRHSIQVIATYSDHESALSASPKASGDTVWQQWSSNPNDLVKSINAHTPVMVDGTLVRRAKNSRKKDEQVQKPSEQQEQKENVEISGAKKSTWVPSFDPYVGSVDLISHVEIRANFIRPLNTFPKDLVAKADTVFPPEQRHLQFRTDAGLRSRIRLRTTVANLCRRILTSGRFHEIETPLLFKSTPEGAREFVVPTRRKGMAYALPQSPQQYKQVLMASGVTHYFQFARCFRDEDLRADRQPEFTQLDLEMSFADRRHVMTIIENLVDQIWKTLPEIQPLNNAHGQNLPRGVAKFPRVTYNEAMASYGSDKPDVRLGSKIHQIHGWLTTSFIGMLTSLNDPIVEMIKVDMQGTDVARSSDFIRDLLESPASLSYVNNPAGMPGIAVYDPKKPLRGLASFGHEGAAKVEEHFDPQPGDILIVQARPNKRFTGGSTTLGNLRRDVHAAASQQGLTIPPVGYEALWVTDFPLFSPLDDSSPGQGGVAGICSTHHPFTAPLAGQDLSKLIADPLDVVGDHYDLVINGVEVGGGSRRIHTADMQELVLRDVLQMKPDRIEDFRHLLQALDSGCPPHAGFALGFDRLMTILTDRQSVRDVIAFPKYADGEDKFVGSPSLLTQDQLATYHLRTTDTEMDDPSPKLSAKA